MPENSNDGIMEISGIYQKQYSQAIFYSKNTNQYFFITKLYVEDLEKEFTDIHIYFSFCVLLVIMCH